MAFIQKLNAATYTLDALSQSGSFVDVTLWVINRRDRVVEIQTMHIAPSERAQTTVTLPTSPSRLIVNIDPPPGGSVDLTLFDGTGTTGTVAFPATTVTGDARWVFDV
jgi:hypothetical protein